jgi:hypothetical protein
MKICDCLDWKPNNDIINGYITMGVLHGMGYPVGYIGKVFEYCPWCGKKLEEAEDENFL